MKRMITTLIFSIVFLTAAQAKVIQHEKIPTEMKACIDLINHHPITIFHYPDFNQRETLKDEVVSYCQCQYQKDASLRNNLNSNKGSIAWAFRDPSLELNYKDQCALEKLNHFSNETIYAIFYSTQIAPFIKDELEQRYGSITRNIASEQSVNQKFRCINDSLLRKCGRIKSLQVTYQCINDNLKNSEYIHEVENSCPEFSPEEVITDVENDYL